MSGEMGMVCFILHLLCADECSCVYMYWVQYIIIVLHRYRCVLGHIMFCSISIVLLASLRFKMNYLLYQSLLGWSSLRIIRVTFQQRAHGFLRSCFELPWLLKWHLVSDVHPLPCVQWNFITYPFYWLVCRGEHLHYLSLCYRHSSLLLPPQWESLFLSNKAISLGETGDVATTKNNQPVFGKLRGIFYRIHSKVSEISRSPWLVLFREAMETSTTLV